MKTKISVCLFLFTVLFPGALSAQNTRMVLSNSKEFPGRVVNVKWVADDILFKEGVNLYRRETDNPFWTRLNETPIKLGDYTIPDSAYVADTSLKDYLEFVQSAMPERLEGMTKAFFLLEMVYSNEFAKYIGVQYDDNEVVLGKSYRYMIKKIQGDREIFEAISEPLTVGLFHPGAPPEGVRVEGKNRKVNLWWKVENERFHSLNVYRHSNVDTIPVKVNPKPVVLGKRPGPDGRMGYPEVYYLDQPVYNDTNYFYRLAGIDFFGRETEYSIPVMASPRNRKPPPPPELNAPEIKLLDVSLNWVPPDSKKVIGQYVYRSASIYTPFERLTNEMLGVETVQFQDKVDKPGYYYYYIATVDKSGNEGKSNMVMADVMDIYPPPAPENLTAVSDSGQITLNWNPVTDENLMGYRIYRTIDANNKAFYNLLNSNPIPETNFVDELPFNARNKFYYIVVSVDSALNMSDYSPPASAIMPDVVPPDVPFIKEVIAEDGALHLVWLPNLESDLKGYWVFREEQKDSIPVVSRLNATLVDANQNSYTDQSALTDTEYLYYLKAVDSTGNVSRASGKYPAIKESQPAAVDMALKNISIRYLKEKEQVGLRWQVQSGSEFKGVVVFRKDPASENYMPVSGLIKDKEYTDPVSADGLPCRYKIIAFSESGTRWISEEYTIHAGEE